MDSLPLELMLNILSLLDTSDLRALARCAKRYAEITRPSIFESVRWHYETIYQPTPEYTPALYLDGFRNTSPHLLGCLLRSLLQNPELGTLIKHLELGTSLTTSDIRWPDNIIRTSPQTLDPVKIDDEVLELLSSLPGALGTITDSSLAQALRGGSIDACCAALLALAPNVESLELGECVVQRSHYIGNAIRLLRDGAQSTSGCGLIRLRRVTLCRHIAYCWSDALEVDFNLVLPIFGLPSVSEASIVLPEPDYYVYSEAGDELHQQSLPISTLPQPKSSTLTVLRLRHSSIRPANLRGIIEVCANLRVLEYGFTVNYASGHNGKKEQLIVRAEQITSALWSVAAHLRELRLSINWWDTDAPFCNIRMASRPALVGSLGSLRDFTKLRVLEAPIALLLGYDPAMAPSLHDILPSSVTSLSLRDDLSHFYDFRWIRRADLNPTGSTERAAEPLFAMLKTLSEAKCTGTTCVLELELLLTTLWDGEEWGRHNIQLEYLGSLMLCASIQYTVVVYVPAKDETRQYRKRYTSKRAGDGMVDIEHYTYDFDVDPDCREAFTD